MLKRKHKILLFFLLCFMLLIMDYSYVKRYYDYSSVNLRKRFVSRTKSEMNYSDFFYLNHKNMSVSAFHMAQRSRYESDQNASLSRGGVHAQNTAFEINEILIRILKKSSTYSKTPDTCSLSNGKHVFVVPRPAGRLGNLMFMFASSLGIATMIQYQLLVPPTHPILKYFDLPQVSDKPPDNLVTFSEGQWRQMTLRNNMEWLCYNFTLRGMLQNYKYFSHVQETVRNSFVFKSDIMETAKKFIFSTFPTNVTKIGIHVRRRDFLTEKSVSEGRVVANISFINKAMNYFRNRFRRIHFIVCTDDKLWCRNNIRSSDVTISEFTVPIIDMAILSLCDHVIITVGTFSWWAGWLSGGIVVHLSDYPVPGSYLERFAPRDNYYPPEWIGMSNE